MSINVTSGDSVNVSVNSVASEPISVVQETTTNISITGISGGSDAHYVYNQVLPSAIWDVTHNLNKKPSVTVVDSADSVVVGDVQYMNNNEVRLTFVGAFSGKAYFN